MCWCLLRGEVHACARRSCWVCSAPLHPAHALACSGARTRRVLAHVPVCFALTESRGGGAWCVVRWRRHRCTPTTCLRRRPSARRWRSSATPWLTSPRASPWFARCVLVGEATCAWRRLCVALDVVGAMGSAWERRDCSPPHRTHRPLTHACVARCPGTPTHAHAPLHHWSARTLVGTNGTVVCAPRPAWRRRATHTA